MRQQAQFSYGFRLGQLSLGRHPSTLAVLIAVVLLLLILLLPPTLSSKKTSSQRSVSVITTQEKDSQTSPTATTEHNVQITTLPDSSPAAPTVTATITNDSAGLSRATINGNTLVIPKNGSMQQTLATPGGKATVTVSNHSASSSNSNSVSTSNISVDTSNSAASSQTVIEEDNNISAR